VLGEYISYPGPLLLSPGRHILAQASIRARPASGRPGRPLSPSSRHQARLLGRRLLAPGWAGFPPPRWAFSQLSGWAGMCDPVRPRTRARVGCPLHLPARPVAGVAPGWAGTSALRLGRIPLQAAFSSSTPGGPFFLPRLGRRAQAGIPKQVGIPLFWLGCLCALFRLGKAGIPWPRPDYYSPGPRFTPSDVFYSSGINSSALCQSWDASRLGLAYPPSSYAGLGMPLGSDQHTPPLLVSLILRRRIRLMTWRS
jgi:hypothetical protein